LFVLDELVVHLGRGLKTKSVVDKERKPPHSPTVHINVGVVEKKRIDI
jgi:hypothetical protein